METRSMADAGKMSASVDEFEEVEQLQGQQRWFV